MKDDTPKVHPASSATVATQPLFVSGRPKPVAYFAPQTHTLQKGIDFDTQLLRQPRAIAFDSDILAQAEALAASQIRVKDLQGGDVWTISFVDFRRYQFSVNRGFGAQLAVELGRWSRNGQPSELAERERKQANKAAQLSMFDAPVTEGWREVYQ